MTEFGKGAERPTTTPPISVSHRPMFGGPAPAAVWLRPLHHYDAANDGHDVRMASSTDGVTWTWGGTWSFPKVGALRLGLVSMNKAGATATFDYLRTYALSSRSVCSARVAGPGSGTGHAGTLPVMDLRR